MLRVRTLITGVAGSPWYVNTYHEGDTIEAAEIASDDLKTFWEAIKAKMVSGLSVQVQTDVAAVTPNDGEIVDYFPVAQTPTTTSGSGSPLPFSNQALVRLSTSAIILGRRVQGRLLVPGYVIGESSFTGAPTAGSISTTTAAATPLMHGGAVGSIGVWARPKYASPVGGVPPTLLLPGSFHFAQAVAMQPKWAVLRSRRD